MAVYFHQTSQFEEARTRIEKHLYDSIMDIQGDLEPALGSVAQFSKVIDRLLDTLDQMYRNPRPGDHLSEKSIPIQDGRYRVFYKIVVMPNDDFDIFMLDIDDNKQSNLDRFPSHRLIIFDNED